LLYGSGIKGNESEGEMTPDNLLFFLSGFFVGMALIGFIYLFVNMRKEK